MIPSQHIWSSITPDRSLISWRLRITHILLKKPGACHKFETWEKRKKRDNWSMEEENAPLITFPKSFKDMFT